MKCRHIYERFIPFLMKLNNKRKQYIIRYFNNKKFIFQELILHNYLRLINSVELFKHLPDTVIVQLTNSLHSEIYMTGDEIVKAGTRGEALYFISSGTVAVYTTVGKEVTLTLS
mgnify:CR=1 FL=1